jgi:mono/diheme cytochrome c family protein
MTISGYLRLNDVIGPNWPKPTFNRIFLATKPSSMKRFFAFGCLFAAVLLFSNMTLDNTSEPKPDGEKIYKQYCVTCHGISGDMGVSGAANLAVSKLTEAERIKVITNGRNNMASFKALLDKDKIKAVAAYTMKLKK